MALARQDGVAPGEHVKASGDTQGLPAIVVHSVWQDLPQLAESCIGVAAVIGRDCKCGLQVKHVV